MEPLTLANPVVRGDMEEIYNSHIEWRQLHDSKIYIEGASGMIASYLVCFFVYLNEVHHYDIQIFAAVRSTEKRRFDLVSILIKSISTCSEKMQSTQ